MKRTQPTSTSTVSTIACLHFGQRQTTALVVLFLFAIYLLVASLRIDSGDGETIYQVSRALVEGRGFAIPPPPADAVVVDPFGEPIPPEQLDGGGPYGAWGRDGRYYAQYGIGQSLLALSLYLAGLAFWRLSGWGTVGFVTRAAVMMLNPLVLALCGAALYRLGRRLGYDHGPALGAALAGALATPLLVYSKTFFSEPLIALALVVAVLGALRGGEGRAGGWVLCGAALGGAVLVKPVALAVTPVFALYALARAKGRWQALVGVGGPLGAAIVVTALYNQLRFGSPFDTGYRTAAWDVAPWVGLGGLLLSPGKGLLWYCPALAAGLGGFSGLARRHGRVAALLGGVAAAYLLVHALYNHWHGGGAWGPRLIVPVVPLLIFPSADMFSHPPRRAWAQLGLALLLATSAVLQLPAVLVHPARALQALYDRASSPTDYTLRLLYRPADSPLVNQWRSLLEVAALTRSPATRQTVIETARAAAQESSDDPLTATAGYLAFNTFDLWIVYWAMLGVPWPPLLAVEAGLAAAAVWAWRRLRRGDG